MDLPRIVDKFPRRKRFTSVAFCLVSVAVLGLAGCKGFFVPTCQENNDCVSATTTGTTSTTSTTATTSTTGTSSTTSTTSTTSSTGTTSTTATTGTSGTTGSSGTTSTTSTTATTGTTGTGPIVPSDSSSSLLYVANANTGTISTFSIASGNSTRVATATVPSFATPTAIASAPHRNFLYLATSDGSIYLNTLDENGNLNPGNNGNPVATVSQPIWMSMDRTGEWLFVASARARKMQEFHVDAATGALQLSSQAIALDPGTPAEAYITPDNRRLFVALGKGGVDEFSFDAATGALGNRHYIATLHRGISADTALTSDDESKNLFVAESNSGIRAFAILPGEPVQEIAGSPFGPSQAAPNALAIDSSRSNVYVTAGGIGASRTLTRYSISGDGSLTPISTTPFSSNSFPAATWVDGSGKYLLSISKDAVPVLSPLSTQ